MSVPAYERPQVTKDVAFSVPTGLQSFADKARDYAAAARSPNTRRAYASDVRAFAAWCESKSVNPFPAHASVVLSYLIDSANTLKVVTLQRRLAAIREHHAAAGFDLDTSSAAFRDAWKGIKRGHGQPAAKKRPLLTVDLRRAVVLLPDKLRGLRDRALILMGFAAALRRSELAGRVLAQREGAARIEERPDGLVIHLARTKTDQLSEGDEVGVLYGSNPDTRPVRNFRVWVRASGLRDGPAFRPINRHGHIGNEAITDRTVARVVQRTIETAALAQGMGEDEARRLAMAYAGHSLRSGLATSAAANDASGYATQRQLRHKRFDTTSGYIRIGQFFKQNPAGMAGL